MIYMKTIEILLWVFLGTIIIIASLVSSYFKYKYRTEQLKYIQENTDDKTFAKYLLYRQISAFIIIIMILGYLLYTGKMNGKL